MLGNDQQVLSQPPIRKNLTAVLQNCEKPAVKAFHRKIYATVFRGFVYNILSKVVVRSH